MQKGKKMIFKSKVKKAKTIAKRLGVSLEGNCLFSGPECVGEILGEGRFKIHAGKFSRMFVVAALVFATQV